jgi:hypothetical protein
MTMDMQKLAEIFEAVKVIPLRPQDFIVFRTSVRLNPEQAAMIHVYVEQETGHSRILIVDGGSDLEVLRFEEPDFTVEPAPSAAPAAAKHRPISEPPAVMPTGKAPGAIS